MFQLCPGIEVDTMGTFSFCILMTAASLLPKSEANI
jgi:hypothetical protein